MKKADKRKVNAEEIFRELVDIFKIKDRIGKVEINIGGVRAKYNGRDAIGDLLQEWLKNWFDKNNFYYRTHSDTQKFPDFLLQESDNEGLLEIKTFNAVKSPAFDIANFSSYSKALLSNPERLDADYLILSYRMENSQLRVEKVWLKKVWEIAGDSGPNPIKLQTKDKQPYNIRPVVWYSKRATYKPFTSKLEFVKAIDQTHSKYTDFTSSYNTNWFKNVSDKYLENTKTKL